MEEKDRNAETSEKSYKIRIINAILLIISILGAMILASNEEHLFATLSIVLGIVSFIFIQGFANIIDLLDSINNKLEKLK